MKKVQLLVKTLFFLSQRSQSPIYNDKSVVVSYFFTANTIKDRIRDIVGDINGRIYVYNNEEEQLINLFLGHNDEKFNIDHSLIKSFIKQNKMTMDFISGGTELTAFKKHSSQNNLIYIQVFSTGDYLSKVYQLSKLLKNVALFAFLVGILLVLVVSYNNYRPIHNLSRYIKKIRPQMTWLNSKNEIESIGSVLIDAIHENDHLKNRVDEQKKTIQNKLVLSILRGENQNDSVEAFEKEGLYLRGPFYCVMVLSIIRDKQKKEYVSKEKMVDIIEKNFSVFKIAYAVEMVYEKHMVVLCNLDSCNLKNAKELISRIVNSIRENNDHIKVGVGNRYSDIQQMNHSYIEALSSLEFRPSEEESITTFFEDIAGQYSHFAWYPSEQVMRFLQFLKMF